MGFRAIDDLSRPLFSVLSRTLRTISSRSGGRIRPLRGPNRFPEEGARSKRGVSRYRGASRRRQTTASPLDAARILLCTCLPETGARHQVHEPASTLSSSRRSSRMCAVTTLSSPITIMLNESSPKLSYVHLRAVRLLVDGGRPPHQPEVDGIETSLRQTNEPVLARDDTLEASTVVDEDRVAARLRQPMPTRNGPEAVAVGCRVVDRPNEKSTSSLGPWPLITSRTLRGPPAPVPRAVCRYHIHRFRPCRSSVKDLSQGLDRSCR